MTCCPHSTRPAPLQDPGVEGERCLHDLDTLPPSDLMDTLLALALAAAVRLLARCPGAGLPPICKLLARFHR